MVPQSLPKTHPFTNRRGQLLRIVVDSDDVHDAYLETAGGDYLGPCRDTGPEILKLAEQGRALWNALRWLIAAVAGEELEFVELDEVLEATAATFDHNEPAEPVRRHNPERPIPLVPEVPRGDD